MQSEFSFIMRNLPACVSEDDIEQMFKFADKGRIDKYRSISISVIYDLVTSELNLCNTRDNSQLTREF